MICLSQFPSRPNLHAQVCILFTFIDEAIAWGHFELMQKVALVIIEPSDRYIVNFGIW